MRQDRQWGYYEKITSTVNFQVGKLTIFLGKSTSIQKNENRAESWTVVKGEGTSLVDGVFSYLYTGGVVHVPTKSIHQIINTGEEELVIIEVQTGAYFGEDDLLSMTTYETMPPMEKSKVVCVSGYFDPLHVGHLEYMEKSKKLGDKLLVIVNNDYQSTIKKGRSFMNVDERIKILESLRMVDKVVLSIDKGRDVCDTLRLYKPDIFANGGDQNNDTIPEKPVCEEYGIELAEGLGEKIQSSRWLIKQGNYNSCYLEG
jgi:cytidyltransferase-like protein